MAQVSNDNPGFKKSSAKKGKSQGPQKPTMSPSTRSMQSKAKEVKSSKRPRLKSIPSSMGSSFSGTGSGF